MKKLALILSLISLGCNAATANFNTQLTKSVIGENYSYASNKEEGMFNPVVKLTLDVVLPAIDDSGNNLVFLYPISSATGVSIEYDRKTDTSYILTNNHFCNGFNEPGLEILIRAQTTAGVNNDLNTNALVNATVIHSDPAYDLCLVSVPTYIMPASLESERKIAHPMDEVIVVGAPAGIFPIIINTSVSGYTSRGAGALEGMSPYGNPFIMLSGQIMPGQSGSPVFNSSGKIIGIIYCGMRVEGVTLYGGLAISVPDIKLFLSSPEINM